VRDPYKILVSEMMLQQTQVERVVPYYKKFIKSFPTAASLARAPMSKVHAHWQGLGYNRRAKYLRDAAAILAKHKARAPGTAFFEGLPGVGHYTARAISAFAYNRKEVFVETNIRTVLFHHGLLKGEKVADEDLLPIVERALKQSKMSPREFYAAMMDYGSHLKKQSVRLNHKSKHYTKQKPFKGSARELRGAILRELVHHQATLSTLVHHIPRSKEEVVHELARLTAEGLVALHGRYFAVKD